MLFRSDDPANLGSDETGGHLAAPVFRDFMIAALKDAPAREFRTPPGLRMYRVSPMTGLPAGAGEPAIWEGYKPGTEPGWNEMPDLPRSGEPPVGDRYDEPLAEAPRRAVAAVPGAAYLATPAPPQPAIAAPVSAPIAAPGAAPGANAPAHGTGGLY